MAVKTKMHPLKKGCKLYRNMKNWKITEKIQPKANERWDVQNTLQHRNYKG